MCSRGWYKHSILHSDPCCHGAHPLLLLFPQDPLAVTAHLPDTASRKGEQWETVYSEFMKMFSIIIECFHVTSQVSKFSREK